MRIRVWHQLLLSGLITLSCTTQAGAEPEVFSSYSVEQAKQNAQKEKKFLIIDFMATWCPPCRQMESTTWADSKVQAWIKENAIAVQIDVDKNRKAASAFNIEAMPTIVLFTPQSSSEFGRQVGYMSPTELITWLEGAKDGKSAEQLEKEQADNEGDNNIYARISKAHDLQTQGKNSEALDEYLSLWKNKSDDQDIENTRISVLPYEMKNLIAVVPSAKGKITELRNDAEKSENRKDWIVLNGVLGEEAKTLAWFDKIKIDPQKRSAIKDQSGLLAPVLFARCRWSDAATYLYPEPLAKIKEYFKRAEEMKKPKPDTEVSSEFDPFPSMVLLVYGAYLGAGRDSEAQKIADECLRLDNTAAMREALNGMAKGMRQARAVQQKAVK